MYCLTINDPAIANRVRPREIYHNNMAQIITEIEIYQMSYMFGNKDMLNFEPSESRGIITISVAQVRFIVEAIPFEQEPKYNGFVTRWYEVGDSYSPPSPAKAKKIRKGLKITKKTTNHGVEIRTGGNEWMGHYDPNEVFTPEFIKFLGLDFEHEG